MIIIYPSMNNLKKRKKQFTLLLIYCTHEKKKSGAFESNFITPTVKIRRLENLFIKRQMFLGISKYLVMVLLKGRLVNNTSRKKKYLNGF